MKPTASLLAAIAATFALTLAAPSADAQPRKPPAPAAAKAAAVRSPNEPAKEAESNRARPRTADTEEGYAYDFSDDLLNGAGVDMHAALIKIRKRGVLRTLIRPRLHFVPELLKSVENL
jgi:hypothetical protein